MYITVKLLNGFQQPLTYKVPAHWDPHTLQGRLVRVPLQNRTEIAVIQEVFKEFTTRPSFFIKQAHELEIIPNDSLYSSFIQAVSNHYLLEPLTLYKRLQTFLKSNEKIIKEYLNSSFFAEGSKKVTLTEEQQKCYESIAPSIQNPSYQTQVIHGVTGSGKTEIYKKLIETTLSHHKTALFLVPEVSLAVQFHLLFKEYFGPQYPLFSFHSATNQSEKKALWQQLMQEKPVLIIGVHLPILLPLPHLGLIIIDEEHASGYQEKKFPKINSKDMALVRAHLYNIPLILGSATPSISTFYNIEKKGWKYHQLTQRFAGAFPTIKVVLLKEEKKRHFWISKELDAAISACLHKKEQVIIFLNRRGYSFFLQCKKCNFIYQCFLCSVSLTVHEDNSLRCHYCSFNQSVPNQCTSCKATDFLKKGIGTQQVVTLLQKLFPQARIARADLDTSVNKKQWQATLEKMHNREIDILVGTQTITKGYHFPFVTLVGVLWADVNMHIPFYNAAETTLTQLLQVAGRAGRTCPESLVIIQTMREYPWYQFLHELQYKSFYTYEMNYRTLLNYPPFKRFIEIEMRHMDEIQLQEDTQWCRSFLESVLNTHTHTILGPAKPPVHKIKNVYIRKFYIKAYSFSEVKKAFNVLKEKQLKSMIFYLPHPLE